MKMSLERDIRDNVRSRPAPADRGFAERAAAARDLPAAASLRGRRRNPSTGTLSVLAVPAAQRGAPAGEGLVERALASVAAATRTARGPLPDFVPDPDVYRTSAGAAVVHLHQHHRGIPVYESVRSVRFDAGGAAREIVGDHVEVSGEVDVLPAVSSADAVMAAARYLAGKGAWASPDGERLVVSRYLPRVLAEIPLVSRPTYLSKRPFVDPVTAHLVLLFCDRGDVRLGWLATLATPGHLEKYDVIVAANGAGAREILYCKGSCHTARGRGNVFFHNPDDAAGRPMVDFPRHRGDYPVLDRDDDGGAFGRPWIADDRTRGNNAVAFRGNKRKATLRGLRDSGAVVFSPADPTGLDQQRLNAFYYCNFLHDFFALLGFGEAQGNFQRENFSDVPGDRDELDIRVFPGPVAGLARLSGRRDGRPCELHLGLREAEAESAPRHTALDADIVYHEYVHGVSTRLAGGRASVEPLRHPESRALGEGYSDYFALTIQSWQKQEEQTVFGAWISGDRPSGLRRHAYTDAFPLHYGHLRLSENQTPHHGGEIWCAALMRMQRALVRELGFDRGHEVGWRLVLDSIMLLPVGQDAPGFLDARDALTRAVDDLHVRGRLSAGEHGKVEQVVLDAFVETRMGPNAEGRGAHFEGIVPDPNP